MNTEILADFQICIIVPLIYTVIIREWSQTKTN